MLQSISMNKILKSALSSRKFLNLLILLVHLISTGIEFHNLTTLLEKLCARLLVFLCLTNILPSEFLVILTCEKEKKCFN